MTDRKQFEAMLEALINGDQETAKEVFHNIVVAKSRDIYEELLESDFSKEEEEEESSEEEEEGSSEEEGSENPFGGEEDGEGEDDAEGEDEFGGEEDGEGEEDMFGGEEDGEGEGAIEDRVMDLEDALDELKAEFEELMAQEEAEGHEFDGETDQADISGEHSPEMGGEMGGEEDELQAFMEYVDKVALPKHGDNGTNTQSVVAKPNRMGGTSANILNGGTEAGVEANKGALKGNGVFKGKPQAMNTGNINVPGGNAGKTAFKKKEPGHGAEKKGSGDTAPNKKSIVGSRK